MGFLAACRNKDRTSALCVAPAFILVFFSCRFRAIVVIKAGWTQVLLSAQRAIVNAC
jgi:hypothetical protein